VRKNSSLPGSRPRYRRTAATSRASGLPEWGRPPEARLPPRQSDFAFLPHPHAARFDLGVAVVTVALEKYAREHLQQLARNRPEF
jgi:hypothetical protein